MKGFRVDAFVLGKLLKTSEPKLYRKLRDSQLDGNSLDIAQIVHH